MAEPEPWTRIYNRVKSQITAAPDELIRQEVFQVMIDFTQDTNVWIEEVPLLIEPDKTAYPFEVVSGTPYRLLIVYNNDPNNVNNANRVKWADGNITMRVPGVIQLFNKPTTSHNWVAVVAKACNDYRGDTGYPEIDDWIVTQYNDVVYYGVMYFLQRMPAKPFGNPQAAAQNSAMYHSQKSQLRVNNLRSNVFGGQAWTYPQTFATITRKGWQ